MSARKSRRKYLIGLMVFLVCGVTWSTVFSFRQSKLNEELVGEISNGNKSAVIALLNKRADPDARVGLDVRDKLIQLRRLLWRDDLLNVGAFDTPLTTAAAFHRLDIARILLDRGAHVDLKDGSGRTALSIAAQSNDHPEAVLNQQVIELLLVHGADINTQDDEGDTPLMFAIFGSRPANVKLLLERGADLLRRNHDGETALAFTRHDFGQHTFEIVSILKRTGASN